ncbi:hypothetical protein [Enterobacter cloacae]|uniref:hypothetical protein n=1 Tax=Enterobacter cloacae TaxID=550 RepID=UPI000E2F0F06|nr:hypothetical protein [Enterobacter cloacae]
MSNIDKQAVQAVADLKVGYTLGHADVAILNELVRIALASLEAEAVALRDERSGSGGISKKPGFNDLPHGTPLFTAPPATVSLTEEQRAMLRDMDDEIVAELEEEERICRAAMLQGADNELQRKASIHDALCEKYNVESLTDFVEWQRNHIAELEAAPPAPVGLGETAVMPDYPGYLMTQRECYQAGKKAGLAEAGKSPVIPDGGEHGFCHKHPDTRLLTHPYIQLMTYPPRPAIYCPKCDPNVTEWVEMDKKLRNDN